MPERCDQPCPRIVMHPTVSDNTRDLGYRAMGVRIGAPVKIDRQACVNVSDDAAKMAGQVYTCDIISVVARTYIQPN